MKNSNTISRLTVLAVLCLTFNNVVDALADEVIRDEPFARFCNEPARASLSTDSAVKTPADGGVSSAEPQPTSVEDGDVDNDKDIDGLPARNSIGAHRSSVCVEQLVSFLAAEVATLSSDAVEHCRSWICEELLETHHQDRNSGSGALLNGAGNQTNPLLDSAIELLFTDLNGAGIQSNPYFTDE